MQQKGLYVINEIIFVGTLTLEDHIYQVPIYAKNTLSHPIYLSDKISYNTSKHISIEIFDHLIRPKSLKFLLGYLKIIPQHEGEFYGKIKIPTTANELVIEYLYIVCYDLLEYNESDFYFLSESDTSRNIYMKTKINKDIQLLDVEFPNSLAIEFTPNTIIKQDQFSLVLKIYAYYHNNLGFYIKLFTNIGTIPIKVIVDIRTLIILEIENHVEFPLDNFIDFGVSLIGQKKSKIFAINNPNTRDMVINIRMNSKDLLIKVLYFIGSNANIGILYNGDQSNAIDPLTLMIKSDYTVYIELSVLICKNVQKSLVIESSVGNFEISIMYKPLSCVVEIRPISLLDLTQGILDSKSIILNNPCLIDLNIEYIETDL